MNFESKLQHGEVVRTARALRAIVSRELVEELAERLDAVLFGSSVKESVIALAIVASGLAAQLDEHPDFDGDVGDAIKIFALLTFMESR